MVGGESTNSRHSRCKRDALPTELTALETKLIYIYLSNKKSILMKI